MRAMRYWILFHLILSSMESQSDLSHEMEIHEDWNIERPLMNVFSYIQGHYNSTQVFNVDRMKILDISGFLENSKSLEIVSNTNGDLRLKTSPDREALCPYIHNDECNSTFLIVVKNNEDVVNMNLLMRIRDVNDNPPIFGQLIENVTFSEDAEIGSVKILPIAKDLDTIENQIVDYILSPEDNFLIYFRLELVAGQPEDCFKKVFLKAIMNNQTISPCLVLLKSLDRESQSVYKTRLIARDSKGLEGLIKINIIVTDVNDNYPVWMEKLTLDSSIVNINRDVFTYNLNEESSYKIRVLENIRNQPIVKLEASDLDDPKTLNSKIKFYLSDKSPHYDRFYIKENILMINSKGLFGLGLTQLKLVVYAEDGGGFRTATNFLLDIEDINDHAPNITVKMITSHLMENADHSKTIVANIHVFDGDLIDTKNSHFNCLLEEKQAKISLIEVQCMSRGRHSCRMYQLYTIPNVTFDHETEPVYRIYFKCSDEGQQSKVSRELIEITIDDENDNEPLFISQETLTYLRYNSGLQRNIQVVDTYTFEVSEDAKHGTVIGTLYTIDRDSAGNNERVFHLEDNSSSEISKFTMPITLNANGDVELISHLDRETVDEYSFYVKAVDTKNSTLSSRALVIVKVTDVNDCIPRLDTEQIFEMVESYNDELIHKPVGQLVAIDNDYGLNGSVKFRLMHPNNLIKINSNNTLIIYGKLDRESQSTIQFDIIVEDMGNQIRLSSTSLLTIHILDLNDNRPRFLHEEDVKSGRMPSQSLRSIELNISLDTPIGALITQVHAKDPDFGENGTVVFSFDNKTSDSPQEYYSIQQDGKITLSNKLKPTSPNSYPRTRTPDRLIVRATDLSVSPMFSILQIYIKYYDPYKDKNYQPSLYEDRSDEQDNIFDTIKHLFGSKTIPILYGIAVLIFLFFLCILIFLLCVHLRHGRVYQNKNYPLPNEQELMNNVIACRISGPNQETPTHYLTLADNKTYEMKHGTLGPNAGVKFNGNTLRSSGNRQIILENLQLATNPQDRFETNPDLESYLDRESNFDNSRYYKVVLKNCDMNDPNSSSTTGETLPLNAIKINNDYTQLYNHRSDELKESYQNLNNNNSSFV